MVSGGVCDRGENLEFVVIGGHSDGGFVGEGGFFSLGESMHLCRLVIALRGSVCSTVEFE